MKTKSMAARQPGGKLEPFEFDLGTLVDDEVEVKVTHCGLCHSDLSMLDNDWNMTSYPFVPGHEVIGKVTATGPNVRTIKTGDTVGIGWFSKSCLGCAECMSGSHNLCSKNEQTIIGRHGGFADRVRARETWAIPLPPTLDPAKAGPLFCGGITVFNPIVQFDVRPTDRVGVIGIGGLGHLALQFLNKWGCEVTAFTSNPAKNNEALEMGAHHVVNSSDAAALQKIAGTLDFIISTVNVPVPWDGYFAALAPRGRLHLVGAVLEPIPVSAFAMIGAQKSLSGSPLGSPYTTGKMLEFCARHGIAPLTESFPMSKVNEAIEHLRRGKARYRIVLENDLS